jgi:hypothetical protein
VFLFVFRSFVWRFLGNGSRGPESRQREEQLRAVLTGNAAQSMHAPNRYLVDRFAEAKAAGDTDSAEACRREIQKWMQRNPESLGIPIDDRARMRHLYGHKGEHAKQFDADCSVCVQFGERLLSTAHPPSGRVAGRSTRGLSWAKIRLTHPLISRSASVLIVQTAARFPGRPRSLIPPQIPRAHHTPHSARIRVTPLIPDRGTPVLD